MQPHYTPEEAEAILRRALEAKPLPGDMSRDQLVAMASELGLSPEQVVAAELSFRSEHRVAALKAEYLKHRRRAVRVLAIVAAFLTAVVGVASMGESDGPQATLITALVVWMPVVLLWAKNASGVVDVDSRHFRRWARRHKGVDLPGPERRLIR